MKQHLLKIAMMTTIMSLSSFAHSGMITGGDLLDESGANMLETFLGGSDLDFTAIFTGIAGQATATQFHNAVDGQGPTVSIYGITMRNGTKLRVGGYTNLNWGSGSGNYFYDPTAFLFNLDTGEVQFTQQYQLSIYVRNDYFATFGNGHDLYGGAGILGTQNGSGLNSFSNQSGYSYSYNYDVNQGLITVAGDSGRGGQDYGGWNVNSLEVFTFNDAAPQEPSIQSVSEPSTLAVLGLSLLGLGFFARRNKK